MKIAAIIQARMGSVRFPGKVLQPLAGRPALELMTSRLQRSRLLKTVCVATSIRQQDDVLAHWCDSQSVKVFRGDEDDVLGRYAAAADWLGADVVVRLTGDCPFICADVVDRVIHAFIETRPRVEYATNCIRRTYPRGLDTEVLGRASLESASAAATSPADREHVTPFVRQHSDRFPQLSVEDEHDNSDLRWTLDTHDDYDVLSSMADALGPESAVSASYAELLSLARRHPEWAAINAHVVQKTV